MNQSMIDKNDGLMARIDMFSLTALSMNASSLTTVSYTHLTLPTKRIV